MGEVALSLDKTGELETQMRGAISEDHERELRQLSLKEVDERQEAQERSHQKGSDKNIVERNKILEKMRTTKEPRQGLVRLTILNAMNVPSGGNVQQKKLRVTVRFPGSSETHYTPFIPFSPNPDFNVSTQALIGNDTEPIIVNVEEFSPKLLDLGSAPKGTPIMTVALNLHARHEGLVEEVTESLVYIERGCDALKANDAASGRQMLPVATIVAKWTFEVRQVDTVCFCEVCGRMKARCSCNVT